jgi:hypothetical protein
MRTRSFISRLIFLAASLLTIAGCGAQSFGPAGPPAQAQPARISSDAKGAGTYSYTCQGETTIDCLVFQGTKLVRTLTKGLKTPLGVAAGADGLFYIADSAGKNVLVYSAGGAKLAATLSDGTNAPVDIAVYKDAVVAANQKTLTYFAKGATKPTLTLKDASAVQGSGAAFDSKGNCYWSFATKSGAQLDEFKGCKGKGKNLKISPGSPYGIAFDGSGNLYYTSYGASGTGVYKCSGVTGCAQTYSSLGFIDPQYVNFSKGFTDLWVNDPGNYQCYCAGLYEIDVSTGKEVGKITNSLSFFNPPTGVASGPGPL